MDRLHEEGVPEHKGEALLFAEVSDPVPAEETFDGDGEVLAVGPEGLDELVAVAGELAVDEGGWDLASGSEASEAGTKLKDMGSSGDPDKAAPHAGRSSGLAIGENDA